MNTPHDGGPAAQKYRLVNKQDRIAVGDERLCDDCETWEPIGYLAFVGVQYDGNLFVPMRRKLESADAMLSAREKSNQTR